MSFQACTRCENWGECCYVIHTLKAHEKKYGRKHPAEKALYAMGYPPPCLIPMHEHKGDTNS